jgi:glutathionylspermidine synthase
MYPNHELLLPASFDVGAMMGYDYVKKPFISREGANVSIYRNGVPVLETEGTYDGPVVYQALAQQQNHDGNYPVIGSWVVDGEPAGIGIREDESLVTGNLSKFVPHIIG